MTIDEIVNDPKFRALSPEAQREVIDRVRSQQAAEPTVEETTEAVGRSGLESVKRMGIEGGKGAVKAVADIGAGLTKPAEDVTAWLLRTAGADTLADEMKQRQAKGAELRATLAPSPDALPNERAAHFTGSIVPAAAGTIAAAPAAASTLAAQAGAGALTGGAQTLGATNEYLPAGIAALLGAAMPAGIHGIKSLIQKLPASLRAGAAGHMVRLLGLNEDEAVKFIDPSDVGPGVAERQAAREGTVSRTAERIGVGTGQTLARRAGAAADIAGEELEAVKSRLANEPVPVDVLEEAAVKVRGSVPRLNTPAATQPAPQLYGPTGQPLPQPPPVPPPPETFRPAAANAADRLAEDLEVTAANYRATQPPVVPGATQVTMPFREVSTIKSDLGKEAKNAFGPGITAEASAKAAAAKAAYAPIADDLHKMFPDLAKSDLTYHESRLVADALRKQVMQSVTNQSPGAPAVALKAAAGAPFLAKGAGHLADLPKSFGALYIAMKVVVSPLWRSSNIATRLAVADAIEKGAFSTAMKLGAGTAAGYNAARASAAYPHADTTPPGEVE